MQGWKENKNPLPKFFINYKLSWPKILSKKLHIYIPTLPLLWKTLMKRDQKTKTNETKEISISQHSFDVYQVILLQSLELLVGMDSKGSL